MERGHEIQGGLCVSAAAHHQPWARVCSPGTPDSLPEGTTGVRSREGAEFPARGKALGPNNGINV